MVSPVEQARTLTLPLFIVSLDDLLLPNHNFQVAHTSFIKFYQLYDFFAHVHACFGSSPPTRGCHPPPSTGNHTPPPSPGLVPSLSMPSLPPPPSATLMSSCCMHVPAQFCQHHPLRPPLLNLPPGCSPTSPSRSLSTTFASMSGEPLKTCSVWGAVPHVSFFC